MTFIHNHASLKVIFGSSPSTRLDSNQSKRFVVVELTEHVVENCSVAQDMHRRQEIGWNVTVKTQWLNEEVFSMRFNCIQLESAASPTISSISFRQIKDPSCHVGDSEFSNRKPFADVRCDFLCRHPLKHNALPLSVTECIQ